MRFGIRQADRRFHTFVVGRTGTGKSTLMATLIRQDIACGRGLALLDPHGDLVEQVLKYVTDERRSDLIYFNAPDESHPLGFNPLQPVSPKYRSLAASGLLSVFKSIWADSWGLRMEHILRNALLALLEQPEANLSDVLRLFDDKAFRRAVATKLTNEQVKRFWTHEYEGYPARLRAEIIAPVQNKVGAFLAHPLLHRILTAKTSSFRLRQVMDEGKLLLVNLSKGRLGEDIASLLGGLLLSRISLSAMSRADVAEDSRRDFHVYVDECHLFATPQLASMLAELRKYHCSLVLASQHTAQLSPEVRDGVLANAGTLIAFRMGVKDAELFSPEFYPEFSMSDLVSLPSHHCYLKLMINGRVSRPFSAKTLPPDAL